MPTLHWIGKDAVVNHHQQVPCHTLLTRYTFRATAVRGELHRVLVEELHYFGA